MQPITRIILAVLAFAFISLPQWAQSVWRLFFRRTARALDTQAFAAEIQNNENPFILIKLDYGTDRDCIVGSHFV